MGRQFDKMVIFATTVFGPKESDPYSVRKTRKNDVKLLCTTFMRVLNWNALYLHLNVLNKTVFVMMTGKQVTSSPLPRNEAFYENVVSVLPKLNLVT